MQLPAQACGNTFSGEPDAGKSACPVRRGESGSHRKVSPSLLLYRPLRDKVFSSGIPENPHAEIRILQNDPTEPPKTALNGENQAVGQFGPKGGLTGDAPSAVVKSTFCCTAQA